MFVKMHRIITQKTCHLFSATDFEWLWVSQLIIRERIDSSGSQNEPLWCEEISLTVFGWAVFTLQCGGVGTLYHSDGNWSNMHTLTLSGHESQETFDVTSGAATQYFQWWQNFIWNYEVTVSFCRLLTHDKQRLWFQF